VVTRLVNRAVLALPGGVVGVLSVMLLGTRGEPTLTGDTSLFQLFDHLGLFCATVLILRVLVAAPRRPELTEGTMPDRVEGGLDRTEPGLPARCLWPSP
jgi:hypothetical protein